MRAMTVEYHAPAVFDDLIEVFVRLAPNRPDERDVRKFAAYRAEDDVLMVTASRALVLIDLDEQKACAIPEAFVGPCVPSKGGPRSRGATMSPRHSATGAGGGRADRQSRRRGRRGAPGAVDVLNDQCPTTRGSGSTSSRGRTSSSVREGAPGDRARRIPVGQGICGAAAASGRTEIVDDVNADPATSRASRRPARRSSSRSRSRAPSSARSTSTATSRPRSAERTRRSSRRVANLISAHATMG